MFMMLASQIQLPRKHEFDYKEFKTIARNCITKPDISYEKIGVISKCERKRLSISVCISDAGSQHQIPSWPQSNPKAKFISASDCYYIIT